MWRSESVFGLQAWFWFGVVDVDVDGIGTGTGFWRVGTGSRNRTGRKRCEIGLSAMHCCSRSQRRLIWRLRRTV